MRVFVAGASGVLGRAILREAVPRGHRVLGLVRGEAGARVVRSLGGEPVEASLFDADALARVAAGAEAVIHAATAIPIQTRIKPEDWAPNDRIRREGTEALTQCAARIGARVYLQQSITWVARPPDGSEFDEDSPLHPDPLTQSAVDGERIARQAGAQAGMAVGVLRCGWFYGPDSAHTRYMAEAVRKHQLPIIGDGKSVWSCLHTEDAGLAFVAAAEAGKTGLWHVVDDRLTTSREFLTTFASKLGAPPPRRVPEFLARLVIGEYGVRFLTASTRTTNARFRAEIGWAPRYPTIDDGLDQIVATWAAEANAPAVASE
jgi:nucleoside-diphosphate-sugar epimerase